MSSRESTPTAPRRSQRERKPTKQFDNATSKGKNDSGSDNDVNEDKQDDDHVATEPDSEDEAGDLQPRAPTRGTRGKRGRGGARSAVTRRKKAAAAGEDAEDGAKLAKDAKISADNPLFNLILSPATALQDTADNFLESLDNSPANALAELINCVLRSCGCNFSVDSDQVMDTDNAVDVLDEFTEGFKTETMPAYPIASKSPIFRKFRKSLAEFITRLVTSAAELGSLYASELMPTLQAWIVPLSGSQIRSFRHTATVVALDMETALCQVAAAVDKELQVLSRQKDGERNKKGGRSKAREQELESKTKEVNTRRTKLKEYLKDIFNTVFVHRSRDHDAAIRADCVHELGVWFTKHPSYFLESGFLPYLGKMLSDQNAFVRLEAARSINALYSKKDYIIAVNHFTQTFKPRLIEMAVSDVDLSVRVNVIQVLLGIDELGLLEDEEREQLCLLVFGLEPRVRNAVAPFVKQAWADEVDQHLVGRSMTEDKAERETQRAGAKCLASLLIKWSKMLESAQKSNGSEDDEENSQVQLDRGWMKDRLLREQGVDKANRDRIGLAVEALWDDMPFIQKWNGLLNLLLMDHTSEVEPAAASAKKGRKKGMRKDDSVLEEIWRLSEQEEEVLLKVLLAALKHAAEEAKAHQKTDQGVEADDEDASLDDITLVLIKALPRLFIKHQTDASRISKVLVIPQLMNIGMYLEMRLITAYETLWDDVSKQFMNHSSPTVLRRAVGTIGHMLSTTSLQNTNKQKMRELEEELGSAIRERIGDRARATAGGRRPLETATLNEEEIRGLSTMLYRVSCLMSIRDMVGWMEETNGSEVRLLDMFTSLMERAKLGNPDEDKVIEQVITILCTYILWKTRVVLSDSTRPSAEDHALRQALKQQRDSIVDGLLHFVVGEDSQVTDFVKRAAFSTVMSIHIMYSSSASQQLLADLQMNLEEEAQFRLAGYIQAVIEEYADDLEEERKARQRDSDTEMDSDISPAKVKRRGRKKKVVENASLEPPSASRMAKDYDFQASIAPFIQGIRAEKISFEHAAVILTHYGRFGVLYDQVSKILTEMLRTRWQLGDSGAVAVVVQNAMRGAYTLYLNGHTHSDEAAISLARLFATYFIHRGAHLAVVGRLPSKSLLEIHKDLIDYLVRKLRHVLDDEPGTTRVASLFRGLMHLVATGTPTEETLKLKEYLEYALERAGIERSGSEKQWEGLRVYERKLTNAPKDKAPTGKKRGRPKKGFASEEDELENALTDDAHDAKRPKNQAQMQPKSLTRNVHKKVAKGRASRSPAASSEAEGGLEAPAHKYKAKDKPVSGRKRKVPSEDEEEPEDAPLVLNGNETPPRGASKSTPFRSATKGSARKRRRGSEEPGEESPSARRPVEKKTTPLPVTNEDDDDDFIGRKLKRIKR